MDSDEAKQMARKYFDGVPDISSDIGFEIVDVHRFDFKEWEVECRVFSTSSAEMLDYTVIIHDDVAAGVR